MESSPDRSSNSMLYPSFSSAVHSITRDPQSTFSIPQYGIQGDYTDSDPMSKAWLEYQHSKESYPPVTNLIGPTTPTWLGSPFQFGTPINNFSNFQGGGTSDNNERSEREESPALRKKEVTTEQNNQQERNRKQSSNDIMEKLKSMERRVSDLTHSNQFLLGRLSEVEKCREASEKNKMEGLIGVDDKERDVVKLSGENSTLKVENQMLLEKGANLLETNKHLEAVLASVRQEVGKLQQEITISDSKVLKLQSTNLNLEHELELIKINQRKGENKSRERKTGQRNGQESLCMGSSNTALTQDQSSLDGKLRDKEDKTLPMNTQLKSHTGNKDCSYSEQQLKELLAKVDAITGENLEEDNEVPDTGAVPENMRDNIQFEKFATSITQCALEHDSNEPHNTLEVKSTGEFEILRTNCRTTVTQFQNEITHEDHMIADLSDDRVQRKLEGRSYDKGEEASESSINETSGSDSFLSLSSEHAYDCDMEVPDESMETKTNETQQKLENKKFQQILAEKELITQRLLFVLNFINSSNGRNEDRPDNTYGERTSPLCFLDQIEKQVQSIMRENTKLYRKIYQLNEYNVLLENRVETTENIVNKSSTKVELPRKESAQTTEINPVNKGADDLSKFNEVKNRLFQELERLESTLNEKQQTIEGFPLLNKLKGTMYELQEELENKIKELYNEKKVLEFRTLTNKYLSPIDAIEKEENTLLDKVQEAENSTRPSNQEWNTFKEATELTEKSLRKTIEELEADLGKSKTEIATLVTVNNNQNVEKHAMSVTLEEIKAGLAKASSRVKELERDLENAKQREKILSITLKKFYDDFKVEREEKETFRSKVKASQEENAHIKVELLTARGVLEKEREAKRIAKGREMAMQTVLDEARQSRELLGLELKMLMDYKERCQEHNPLQPRGLKQDLEEEQRLRKLGQIVESINGNMARKVTLRFDQLQELLTLRDEIVFMKEENGALKTKITRLRKHSNLFKEEKRKLSIEVQRLNSVVNSSKTNELNSNLDEPEGSEQSLPIPEIKQKDNVVKKSLRRRLSGFSNSGSNRKIDLSSSKELHPSLDKRMSQVEDELALLRNELHGKTLPLDDGLEIHNSSQASSNDSEESETSEESVTKEMNQRPDEIEPITSRVKKELEHEIKIDLELQELKQGLTAVIAKTREQLDASNDKMRKVSEELENKDKVLKSLQNTCKNLEAEKDSSKKENISLHDALEREIDAKIESIEKQKHLELMLNEALKAKPDMECHDSYSYSGNSVLEGDEINRNGARKKELEELREVLHSIYDPINTQEAAIKQLRTDLKSKQEEIKLLKQTSENCASVELTNRETITSLKNKLHDMQHERVLLKEENETLKRRKGALKEACDGCQSKTKICDENPAKLIDMNEQLRKETSSRHAENENHKERSKACVDDHCESSKSHFKIAQKTSLENALRESEGKATCLMEQLKTSEESKARVEQLNDTMRVKLQKYINASEKRIKSQKPSTDVPKTVPENVKHENALNAKLLRLNSDLNIAEQEKTHLESTLSFINCTNKSYETEVYSLRVELEKEIASKCAYKDREARLQDSLNKYREELERLRDEVQRLYESVTNVGSENLELEKTILSLSAENAKLKANIYTRTDNLLGNEKIQDSLKETSEMIHHFQEETKHSEEELIRRLTKEQEQREKAEKELSSLKELSKRIEEQQAATREKLQGDFKKVEEKLNRTMQRLVEDQERNKNVSEKLVKALEDKTKAEEDTRTVESQRRDSVKELEETKRRLRDLITNEAVTKAQNDEAIRKRLSLLEDERKTLNQQIIYCENNRKKIEDQGNEEIRKLRGKIKILEQVLIVNEEEKLRLREENKKIEEDIRKLSEQVSEEVESVRNESREIEAVLQKRIERLQSELKASKEQVTEENENFKTASEECKRITQEYENCKAVLTELKTVAKEHENCNLAIKEYEQLRASWTSLSDNMVMLKDELTKAEDAKAKYQESITSLKEATTALYIEVITLKAQLEILAVDNLKAVERNNHLQSLYEEAVSASRGSESEVNNTTVIVQKQEKQGKDMTANSGLSQNCSGSNITEAKVCVEDEQSVLK